MSKAPAQEEAVHAYGWAARDSSGILSPYHFTRRANGDNDITIKIQYCGICHGDIHLVKNKVWSTIYPTVPGKILYDLRFCSGDGLFMRHLAFVFQLCFLISCFPFALVRSHRLGYFPFPIKISINSQIQFLVWVLLFPVTLLGFLQSPF
ncbi:putative 8-hydroxygeraniol dehydrogenase [Rosa chinensis]|uniref:Putative 8-hydroxygeraniol dehydrogenase n=1 Tax=Rosa chinensis TaxID=74649 RepID=A0A2P6RPR5_ROSCH|nr:putative 8-hydroxygeraniol dehydrogenase [Rosa chinensis]